MQIKIYSIPVMGGEALMEEMNVFLRSKKVLEVEKHFYTTAQNASWSFCVSYIDDVPTPPTSTYNRDKQKEKVDYSKVLDAPSYERFEKMRVIRKRLADEEGAPAYTIFTDEEMSNIAKIENLTLANMKTVKGVGEKKTEKYGQYFLTDNG